MEKPTRPTSGTWAGDAQALLEMGATQIDRETVRGLLAERVEAERVGFLRGVECAHEEVRAWSKGQIQIAQAKEAEDAPCAAEEHRHEAAMVRWVALRIQGVLDRVKEAMCKPNG